MHVFTPTCQQSAVVVCAYPRVCMLCGRFAEPSATIVPTAWFAPRTHTGQTQSADFFCAPSKIKPQWVCLFFVGMYIYTCGFAPRISHTKRRVPLHHVISWCVGRSRKTPKTPPAASRSMGGIFVYNALIYCFGFVHGPRLMGGKCWSFYDQIKPWRSTVLEFCQFLFQ